MIDKYKLATEGPGKGCYIWDGESRGHYILLGIQQSARREEMRVPKGPFWSKVNLPTRR